MKNKKSSSERIQQIINEIKPLVEKKLDIEFNVTLVERHVCLAQPAFSRMIIGEEFVISVCHNNNYDATTAIVLIMTHEALHLKGMQHNAKGRRLGFYSNIELDTYTPGIALEVLSEEE